MGKPSQYGRSFAYKYSHFGTDTNGHDIKAFGDTTGKFVMWDASADTFYVTGTLSLDGTFNADNIALVDAETLTFGTSSDVVMQWDGTNFIIAAAADDSLIEIGDAATSQKSFDIKWYANEASGASYLYFDASGNLIYTTGVDFQFLDNDYLVFGTGAGASGDVNIRWDGTNLIINTVADDKVIEIGDSAATQLSFDLKWYANEANGASYLYADASENLIYTTGVDFQFKDNDVLVFGTGAGASGDVGITYDANSLNITPTAVSDSLEIGASGHVLNTTIIGTLTVGVNDTGNDVKLYGATAGVYMLWDESEDTLSLVGKYAQGVSGTPVVNDTASVKFFQQYVDCGATSGESIGTYLRHYTTGTGGSGNALRAFETVSDVAAVNARGAHISLNFGSTGTVTGSGQALTTTLHIADQATQAGTLSAITAEIYADGDTSDPAGSVLSLIRCSNGGGAGKDDIDDDCALFHIDDGFTVGDGNMIAIDNSPTTTPNAVYSIKIRIGSTTAYLYAGTSALTAS